MPARLLKAHQHQHVPDLRWTTKLNLKIHGDDSIDKMTISPCLAGGNMLVDIAHTIDEQSCDKRDK